MSEQELRKNWHKFFVKNRNRFVEFEDLAKWDTELIYVEKSINITERKFPCEATEINYEGCLKDW